LLTINRLEKSDDLNNPKHTDVTSYQYLMLLCQHRAAGRSVAKIQRMRVINAHRLLRGV